MNKFIPSRTALEDPPGYAHNNGTRADRAEAAVEAWRESDQPTDEEIRDCISDLMHLAHKRGLNPIEEVEMAVNCWREESHNYSEVT